MRSYLGVRLIDGVLYHVYWDDRHDTEVYVLA